MSEQKSVWLLGGPDAGKSNYLTRTWLAIRERAGLIELAALPDEFEYLNTASSQLSGGRFVSHTSRGVHVQNSIPVRTQSVEPQITGDLVVPDYSGEDWIAIHAERRWSEEWESRLGSLAGCLVFLRASSREIVATLDWFGCHKAFGIPLNLGQEAPADGEYQSPTQVVVIDWLQMLRQSLRSTGSTIQRLRVGIVISAWDLVPVDQKSGNPSDYVKSDFPLLSQFIESNSKDFEFAFFGVSIAGADFDRAPGFREEFLNGTVTDFGYVLYQSDDNSFQSRDHTLPIAWALGVDVVAADLRKVERG
jgi:hypothetical protein